MGKVGTSADQATGSGYSEGGTWVYEKGLPRVHRGLPIDSLGRRILLATDLSDASREAEARGIELAETPGARLLILAIVRPETTGNVPQQKRLAALLRLARRRGMQAEGRLLTDRPAESILLVAAATGTDVIVMGRDQWRGWAAGADASGHVVLHAPCPVLIARASRAAWPAPSPGYDRPHIALEHAIPKQSAEGERIPPR